MPVGSEGDTDTARGLGRQKHSRKKSVYCMTLYQKRLAPDSPGFYRARRWRPASSGTSSVAAGSSDRGVVYRRKSTSRDHAGRRPETRRPRDRQTVRAGCRTGRASNATRPEQLMYPETGSSVEVDEGGIQLPSCRRESRYPAIPASGPTVLHRRTVLRARTRPREPVGRQWNHDGKRQVPPHRPRRDPAGPDSM